MARIVLDVNVLVSSLINPREPAGRIQGLWRRDEVGVIRARPKFSVTNSALEGKANFVVSGDTHLKSLGTYQNIPILSPAEVISRHKVSQ